jgi:hypothetical protein
MEMKVAVLLLCLTVSPFAFAQAPAHEIANSDVISMTKAGIGEQTIMLAIQHGPVKFDTSPQALIVLKRAGVSDKVLNAILSLPKETDSESKRSQPHPVSETAPQQPTKQENSPRSMSVGESRKACTAQPGETFVASSARSSCCEMGFGSSCSNLARLYATGTQGLPLDLFAANDLKKRACALGQQEECYVNISDQSERLAFENAVGKEGYLETFLQVYPQSVAKPAVLGMLANIKRQAAATTAPPPTPSPVAIQRPPQTASQGLTLRVLQEQSIPYTAESGGGMSTSCNIVGTANTSAYVSAYGNSAYGNATTNSNQHMSCNSYDTTMRWPHVLNVMFAQASDGNSYIIACDRAWRWSKCNPLRAGEVFSANFTGKGIEVQAIDSKGKAQSLTYQILQSKTWR